MNLTNELFAYAAQKEIDLIGCTNAEPITCRPWRYDEDQTHYLPCEATKIAPNTFDPKKVLPEAKCVIMVGMYMYGFDVIKPSEPGRPRGNIGPWTRGYVEAGRYATDAICDWLKQRGYLAEFSNTLPYRSLAVQCGLGQIGNNGFLYHKNMGSYIRLGCVVTNAPLKGYDGPVPKDNDCGACRLCQKSCPTGALKCADGLDADLCLHLWLQGQGKFGGNLPPEQRHKCGNYLMRTGRCLSVCPKNRKLVPRSKFPFAVEEKEDSPELIPLVLADEETFMRRVPYHVYKYGIEWIRRNAIIALGNSKDPAAIPVLQEGLKSLSPMCRGVCAWSLGEIGTSAAAESLSLALTRETDPLVLEEIHRAIKIVKE